MNKQIQWSAQRGDRKHKPNNTRKTALTAVSALTATSALLAGCAPAQVPAPQPAEPAVEPAALQDATQQAQTLSAQRAHELSATVNGIKMDFRLAKGLSGITHVENVQGSFSYNQDILTPNDAIFNLFGTAVTGICAKPAAESIVDGELEDWEISVSGDVRNAYTTKLVELAKERAKTRTMSCACSNNPAGGSIIANAAVTGVPLKDIIEIAGVEAGVNTLRVVSDDGYEQPMPLSYALERDALLVYKINGEDVPAAQGNPVQLWMPSSVAKYFTRRVVNIKLTREDAEPTLLTDAGKDGEYLNRPNVAILNYADGETFPVGQPIELEGYADDYDKAIARIEFSMDEGATWTAFDTSDSTSDKWVYWFFTYTPEAPGDYALDVRSVAEDGTVSPLSSTMVFTVA